MTEEEKELESTLEGNDAAAGGESSSGLGELSRTESENEPIRRIRMDRSGSRSGRTVEEKAEVVEAASTEEVQEETPEAAPILPMESAAAASQAEEEPKPDADRLEVADKAHVGRSASADEESGSQVDYSRTLRSLSRGDLVDGVVVHIDKEGVLVDVGTKSEGIIRPSELSSQPVESPEDVVSVGEQIAVYVMESEDKDGNLVLSKKRADFERAWDRVQQAFEEGKVLTAMVTDRVKGGLQVDLGIRGFVPGSHVGSGKVTNLERYVGQSLPLKVIEVDRERRKVVLSHRLAVEEQRGKQREHTMASLVEGQIRDGTVRRITDYGAFIDLGGLDGLLHISEMSWTRITHPSEVVKVGQKIKVMVLRLDPTTSRVSLGLRQILPDPWAHVEDKYKVGDVISGTISRLVPFGVFVQLGDIEAIIPNTELSRRRVKRPDDVVSVGETVEARIIDIRAEERRMTLSLRQLQEEKERRDYEGYQSSSFDGRMTLGDLVGDKLQELVSADRSAEAEPAAKAEAASSADGEVVTEAEVSEEGAVSTETGAADTGADAPEAERRPKSRPRKKSSK